MSEADSAPSKGLEPAAYMAYNNSGGAGLVPYLLKDRAERNTMLANGEGPPAYDTDDFPHPLFAAEDIRELLLRYYRAESYTMDESTIDVIFWEIFGEDIAIQEVEERE